MTKGNMLKFEIIFDLLNLCVSLQSNYKNIVEYDKEIIIIRYLDRNRHYISWTLGTVSNQSEFI